MDGFWDTIFYFSGDAALLARPSPESSGSAENCGLRTVEQYEKFRMILAMRMVRRDKPAVFCSSMFN